MNIILVILLIIITVNYLFELLLDVINLRSGTRPVPEVLNDVYDSESYARQQEYERTRTRFGFLQGFISFIILAAALYFGLFGKLHLYIAQYDYSPVWSTLIFFGVLFLILQLISIPFSLWFTFVIEEKFGFNRVTPTIFIMDFLKSLLVTLLLMGGVLWLITKLFYSAGPWFWLLALGALLVFSLLANVFYSSLIVPLFNKQTPLQEGELLHAITKLAQETGFPISKVYVIDGSKRSSKANAYFTGFGRRRRVVLYDTLIESLEIGEVVAVLAHEIGHYKKKHLWKNFALGAIHMALMLFIFNIMAQSVSLSVAMGFEVAQEPVFHLSLLAFGLLFSPIEQVLGIGMNMISRRMEYEADDFAKSYRQGNGLIVALKKLSKTNYSNLTPHPAYVFVNYSHPTLFQRIQKISEGGVD